MLLSSASITGEFAPAAQNLPRSAANAPPPSGIWTAGDDAPKVSQVTCLALTVPPLDVMSPAELAPLTDTTQSDTVTEVPSPNENTPCA